MWFSMGFAAACAGCSYFWITDRLYLTSLIMAVLFAILLAISFRFRWIRCAAAVYLGCLAGLLWFQIFASSYLLPAAQLDGRMTYATVHCTDYGYKTDYGTAAEGVLKLHGKIYRTKLYFDGEVMPEPGDEFRGKFEFRVTTPDGADEPTAHQGKGIFLLAYQEEALEHRKPANIPDWTFPSRLRYRLLEILDVYFPEDTAAFAKALLLGDRSGIDYETNTAFKISGISHVIAVSGLHVSILFTLISTLCFKRRYLIALVGIPALVLFAAAAGFSPSITRACIMQCLMILAMLLNRDYDGPTELAFSCLVMLLVNPLVITAVSFQLSVGCMIGIFLFSQQISTYLTDRFIGKSKRLLKVKHWIIGSVSVTLSSMVATTPLVALYFGTVSLIGIPTNLLTLWVISFIFYGIMLVCVFSTFWTAAACFTAAVIAWPIRYVLVVSKTLSALPLSAVYTAGIYIVIWLTFCYILLGVFLLSKKKQPVVFGCCMVIGLCLALGASWMEPLIDHCRMSILDVGEGQCILLQSEGKTYLVDCGGNSATEAADIAAEHLLSQGVSHLDGAILTHYDADHSGGMEYLLSRIPADLLIVPDSCDEKGILRRLLPFAEKAIRLSDNIEISYGTTRVSFFGPAVPDSGNESSLAILFRHENCDILITGDRSGFGERILLKRAQIPDIDILVAGHHGSEDSTCEELLCATTPEIVAISVGENHYDHPAQEVLDRLNAMNCTVYRTDIHGNIVLRR